MLSAFAAVTPTPAPVDGHSVLLPELPDLLWGSIAFLIILAFFIWKGLPRINAALDARVEAIEGGLKRAEEAQADAKEALEKYNEQLADGRAEAAKLREQAREDAKVIRAELVEQAQAEAARVVASAKAQIEVERAAALASLRADVGSLALGLASSVVGESLNSDKRSSDIVDRFLSDLEASEATKSKA
ncbi:MAG: F0F1 ATP synthase subunit B [Rhodoglobus sp.]